MGEAQLSEASPQSPGRMESRAAWLAGQVGDDWAAPPIDFDEAAVQGNHWAVMSRVLKPKVRGGLQGRALQEEEQ